MKWLIYDAKWLKLMLRFLRYFISKFEIRQIGGSRKTSVNVIVIFFSDKFFLVIIKKRDFLFINNLFKCEA